MSIEKVVDEMLGDRPDKTCVLYHAACSDGFGAAWAAYQLLGSRAQYIPAHYGKTDPLNIDAENLLIVDFSFKLPTLLELPRKFKNVLVLDHHIGAQKALEEFGLSVFDNDRSGAGITWDVLHRGAKRPRLIDYIEDRDLWKKSLPHSDEIAALVEMLPDGDFAAWNKFAARLEEFFDVMVDQGKAVLEYKTITVERQAKNARMGVIDGYEVPVVNCIPALKNEIGNKLAIGQPFAAVWAQNRESEYVYSLRSDKDGLDCSKIAAKFGGGGHKHSAAFIWPKLLA